MWEFVLLTQVDNIFMTWPWIARGPVAINPTFLLLIIAADNVIEKSKRILPDLMTILVANCTAKRCIIAVPTQIIERTWVKNVKRSFYLSCGLEEDVSRLSSSLHIHRKGNELFNRPVVIEWTYRLLTYLEHETDTHLLKMNTIISIFNVTWFRDDDLVILSNGLSYSCIYVNNWDHVSIV